MQANRTKKQPDIIILISDKIDSRLKLVRKDREAHFLFIKGKLNLEDIIIINIDAPHLGASNFIRNLY